MTNQNTALPTSLPKRLRIKSNMINLGERIKWGSETALMDEAADEIERLQATIKTLEMQGKWLPIETAPKDGSFFLGFSDTWKCPSIVRWQNSQSGISGYWDCTRVYGSSDNIYPTHWQPLPNPPPPDAQPEGSEG